MAEEKRDGREAYQFSYMGREYLVNEHPNLERIQDLKKILQGPDIMSVQMRQKYYQEIAILEEQIVKDIQVEARKEMVNHPAHYGGEEDPYEAIKVIRAWNLDFCTGNTVKYIARAGKKDPTKELEDLKKARWYLDYWIKELEKRKKNQKSLG